MNPEPNRTRRLPAGTFITETAVRGVFGRLRRMAQTGETEPVDAATRNPTLVAEDSSAPAGPRPLRRWSIAELIARAATAPPRTA